MPDRNDVPSLTEDQLREDLRRLYNDALPHVTPPGVDLVRRGAHRRAATQTAATVVLVALMVVAALAQPWRAFTGGIPAAPPTSTSTPVPSTPRPESTTPTTSASPSASTSPSAGTGTAQPSGGSSTGSGSSGGGTGASSDDCVRRGIVDVIELISSGYVTVSVRASATRPDEFGLLCPGETVRVLWASYTVDPAGAQHLYRFEERVLDHAQPTWRMHIDMKWDGLCGPTWYVSRGSDAIPSTIPLGESAFPNKVHWDDQNAKAGCDPTPIPS